MYNDTYRGKPGISASLWAPRLRRLRTDGAAELARFIRLEYGRIGADQNLTPREVIRDFIELLDLLYQNPALHMDELLQSDDFTYARSEAVSDQTDKNYAEFTI